MKFEHAYFSGKGPRKQENEDRLICALSLSNDEGTLFAIADGMGGQRGGGIASDIAVNTLSEFMPSSLDLLANAYKETCVRIRNYALDHPEYERMGTTLTCCIFSKRQAFIGHVGDTRIYQIRGDGIMRRTTDQTELQELLDQGVISEARARNYPRKNILVSALTAGEDFKFERNTLDIQKADRFVLLSDGVYQKVLLREINDISKANKNIDKFAKALQEEVEKRGPTDDYSAICIEIQSLS